MSRKSRNTYAKPIPMNTMTVQMPFVDEQGYKNHLSGGLDRAMKRTTKSVTWKELLRAFPTRTAGTYGPVICACKLSSVVVGPATAGANVTVNNYDSGQKTVVEGNQYVLRAPKIVFGDGVQFEAATRKLLKARPSDKNVFNSGGWKNIAFNSANGMTIYNGGVISYGGNPGQSTNSGGTVIDDDVAFTYEGELKTVTMSFRLVDRIEIGDISSGVYLENPVGNLS